MPRTNSFVWLIGGEAGYGIMSSGEIFARTCMKAGLSVFTNTEYPSLIRGGHNAFMVRAAEYEVNAHSNRIDVLVALNQETIDRHIKELNRGAAVIFDPDKTKVSVPGAVMFPVPFSKIIAHLALDRITANSISLGASVALLGLDFSYLESAMTKAFGKKAQVIEQNLAAAKAGYSHVKDSGLRFDINVKPISDSERLLMTGNDAFSIGAIAAGCKYVAIYPMTPTSPMLHRLAAWQRDYDIVVVQPEDEISGINSAIGASFAGVRSLVATSGGGFSLMSEAFGMSAMTETPLVVVMGQRGGPSTGLPTRTSQSDLQFVIHASQGEFSRVIIAPGDVTECFYAVQEAFNLADRWQIPVVVLADKHVCECYKSIAPLGPAMKIDRGEFADRKELERIAAANEYFPRYKFTETGVSPRTHPGQEGGIFRADSDEHDEYGYLNEEPDMCKLGQEKRLNKLVGIANELPEPRMHGPEKADITIIGWGSTKGPIIDALPLLKAKGITANFLQIYYVWPFPAGSVGREIDRANSVVCLEQNATGQLTLLVREQTGKAVRSLLKYTGRQWTPEEVAEDVEKFVRRLK